MDYKSHLRSASSSKVNRVSISEIAAVIEPVNLRLVNFKETDKNYLHLVAADGTYFPIGLGATVVLEGNNTQEKMTNLMKDYVIYTGTSTNGNWFSFGKAGELPESELVPFAAVFATIGAVAVN
ncbi:MAG: hypothetical protein WCP46_00525 [Alphaproteobacteria bacterium]